MKILIKSTKQYDREISKFLSQQEREKMENEIALDPLYWPVMRGTGGIRKARFSRDGMGKRGGGRICYFYLHIKGIIYMLKAYAKNEQENLSDKDKKQISWLLEHIVDE